MCRPSRNNPGPRTRERPRRLARRSRYPDAKLGDDIVGVSAFRGVTHGKPRNAEGGDVDHALAKDAAPGSASLLGKIVVSSSEAGKIDGHEAIFAAERITNREAVPCGEEMIDANGTLIGEMAGIAGIEEIVAVHARADDSRLAHHGGAARHAGAPGHIDVGTRNILLHEQLGGSADSLLRDSIVRKGVAKNAWIGGANGFRGIEVRIGMGCGGIVDDFAAHAEIA